MKQIIVVVTVITTLISCNSVKNEVEKKQQDALKKENQEFDYVKGELIVLFDIKEDHKTTIATLQEDKNISLIKVIFDSGDTQIAHFKVPVGKEKEYIEIIQKHPNVKSAELNQTGKFI